MKQHQGFSAIGLIASIVVVVLLGIATIAVVNGNNNATNYDDYDFNSIISPDEHNGNIGDHVKGDPNAPVLIFEYADYQCPGCSSINPTVNKAIEEFDGKLAVVYRNFLLSYHKNGTAAASAAEAAGLQGFWKPYANKLFSEQAEWEYASTSERTELFEKYFLEVTDGKGDMERFRQDIASNQVSQKISFDMGLARRVDVPSTPAFYIDDQHIKWNEAGEITINNEVIKWDKGQSGDDFIKLLKKIVEAKLK